MSAPESEKVRTSLHSKIRAAIVLVLLAITVFILAWGTLTVVETSPQARNLAIALWLVGIVVISLSGVRLKSVTDDTWIVALVRSYGKWAGMSWTRLAVSTVGSAIIWYGAWLTLFAANVTVKPVPENAASGSHCEIGWALIREPCSDTLSQIWAPMRQVNLYVGDSVSPCRQIGSTYTCADPDPEAATRQSAVPATERPELYVYLQMSKAMEYERSIRDGIVEGLESRLGSSYNIIIKQGVGTTSNYWNAVDRWRDIVDEIITREPLTQYIVTIGSGAAVAVPAAHTTLC